MYRVNRKGDFNVPYGCKPGTVIVDHSIIRAASETLHGTTLIHSDFGRQIVKAGKGDLVYCDPPYTVKHDNNGFLRYNESIFSWDDQVRLSTLCRAAAKRGVRIIVSNARHQPIRELYADFEAQVVHRNSMISGTLEGRGSVAEYLFTSPIRT
jgi:DNA adenine methylase